jgi:ornithine cyclodeaminase/thiomorpholine-carboxylate dehydrogenase
MLSHAHDFNEIRIASYHPADAEKLASANSRARAFGTFSEAVDGADVVCLCTSSATPVVQVGWLKPGCHVNSVGYAPPGGELPRDLVLSSRLVVETRMAFTAPPVGCAELSGLDAGLACELGEILAGKCPGRRDDAEITVYKAMGHAMEDLVAANIVYQNARARGVGQIVEL